MINQDVLEPDLFLWVLILLAAAGLVLFALRVRREYLARRKEVEERREGLFWPSASPDIERSIRAYRSGAFTGADQSPLAYIGYRVGKTHGLHINQRRKRLQYCFQMRIPEELPSKYRNWGRPLTFVRYRKMSDHLAMLANQRRARANYEVAVGHWDMDREWFINQFGELATQLRRYGFRT